MTRPYIVGITGGSASGKTQFLKGLIGSFKKEEVCFISQDEYYKTRDLQPLDVNGIENFDSPHSIDVDQFLTDLEALTAGEVVMRQEYTFNNPYLEPDIITYEPAPIIVVEGIFVLYFPDIAQKLDLKVFLDAKEHIKLRRRIKRDKEERGYNIEDVLYRYEHHVAPTYEKYIEPFKYDADIIIPNNHHFENALEMLTVFLKNKLS